MSRGNRRDVDRERAKKRAAKNDKKKGKKSKDGKVNNFESVKMR